MTIGIVTARAGSKGVPNKNTIKLGGIPLINHTIFTAIESKSFDKIYVSTDIDYIFSEFKTNNSVTLIKRPVNLCQDDSSQVDVVNHVFENLLNPKLIKSFVLLQPTSPFKTANEISSGVKMLSNTNVQSVIGVCEVVNHPSDYLFVNSNGKIENLITESKNKRRQEFSKYYFNNGAFYGCTYDFFVKKQVFYDHNSQILKMNNFSFVDIDTQFDMLLSKSLYKNFKKINE